MYWIVIATFFPILLQVLEDFMMLINQGWLQLLAITIIGIIPLIIWMASEVKTKKINTAPQLS